MNTISTLAEKKLQPGGGHRIPNAAYHEPGWLEQERVDLFEQTWNFVGVVNDLPEPGDYLTKKVGRAPILVVRGRDNEIRAFHNFCRHRGAQLLEGEGHCSSISCPYHAWNFGLDGQLRKVPLHNEEFANVKLEDWPLLPVDLEIFSGMIFVRIGGDSPPVAEWLGELGDYLKQYQIGELVELQRYQMPIKANWKYFVENHIDWLHLFFLHAKTLNMYDHEHGYWKQAGEHWMSFEVQDERKTDDIEKRAEGLLEIPGIEAQGAYGAHLIFPNLPIVTSSRSFSMFQSLPDGPDASILDIRLYAMPGSELPESRKEENQVVMREDKFAAERMQMTVASPYTRVGPLAARYEEPVVDFHSNYLKYLS